MILYNCTCGGVGHTQNRGTVDHDAAASRKLPRHFRKEKNMTTNEILELVRAGYTKSEIEAMNGTAEQEQTAPEQTAPEQTEHGQAQEHPTENGNYKELTELVKNLTETVKAMQADNARKVSGEPPKRDTAESAIKSFFGDIPKN